MTDLQLLTTVTVVYTVFIIILILFINRLVTDHGELEDRVEDIEKAIGNPYYEEGKKQSQN